jgi:hypothetical protein
MAVNKLVGDNARKGAEKSAISSRREPAVFFGGIATK